MPIAMAADENFNQDIVRGVKRRRPDIDFVSAQDAGLSGADDRAILAWAAREHRVLFTHDVQTLTKYAFERVRAGQPMSGVFEVSRKVPLGLAIEEIILLADYSLDFEWEGQVRYLPLA